MVEVVFLLTWWRWVYFLPIPESCLFSCLAVFACPARCIGRGQNLLIFHNLWYISWIGRLRTAAPWSPRINGICQWICIHLFACERCTINGRRIVIARFLACFRQHSRSCPILWRFSLARQICNTKKERHKLQVLQLAVSSNYGPGQASRSIIGCK